MQNDPKLVIKIWDEYTKMNPTDIKDNPENPRVITDGDVEAVMKSIVDYGFTRPLIILKDSNTLVVGHTTKRAAIRLGMEEVPVLLVSLEQAKALGYMIADNKLGENTDWNYTKLRDLLQSLDSNGYDVASTGYDDIEIQTLIDSLDVRLPRHKKESKIPDIVPKLCKAGDLWKLGDHKLLCGDATNKHNIKLLVRNEKIHVVFTDPPFDMEIDTLYKIFENVLQTSPLVQFWMGSDKQQVQLTSKFYEQFTHFFVQDLITSTMVNSKMPMGQHNLISKFGNVAIQNLKDAFSTIVPVNTLRASKEHKIFNMGKRVELPYQFIIHYSTFDNTILDVFGGLGSTLIASEKSKRKALLMEIDPRNCDAIIERFVQYTGIAPVLDTQ